MITTDGRRNPLRGSSSGKNNPMYGVRLIGEKNGMFGKHHTESTIQKIKEKETGIPKQGISESNRRRVTSQETRDKLSVITTTRNLMQTDETRFKKSVSLSGERNPMWKGGVSFEPYCIKFNPRFKERVRKFFNYECVECHKTQHELGRKLDVHHVNYDKMVCCNDVKPLFVSLCRRCNSRANGNRSYWEKHFTSIIHEIHGGRCYCP
jgi:NUMOD3 motif